MYVCVCVCVCCEWVGGGGEGGVGAGIFGWVNGMRARGGRAWRGGC